MKKGIVTGITIGLSFGILIAITFIKKLYHALNAEYQEKDKFRGYYMILEDWLAIREEGISLGEYFIDNHFNSIAIYGMGNLGKRLYDDLKDTDIIVEYGIDQHYGGKFKDIEIKGKNERLKRVDAIVVTPIFAFDSIKSELVKIADCPIVSLEEVIYPLCRRV